jgi:predicted RNase H-like HicB family nuclease
MRFSVLFEAIQEPGYPVGYYYAHVPSLGLTTHGLGVDGARQAATDLVRLWLEEKRAHGEKIATSVDALFGTVEVPEGA